MYRVGFKSANFLRTSSVIAALAASVVVLGATVTPAQATFPGKNGKIAFTHSGDIYTVDPDGTHLTNLTADLTNLAADIGYTSGSEGGPAWSPDGAKIAFSSDINSKSVLESNDIYVMDADGSNPKRLTNNDYRFQGVGSWSPDGAKMVLSCYRTVWEVCVMDADGSNHTQLTSGDNESPTWSPDGTKIAFRGSSGGIHTMNPDGSNKTLAIAGGDQPDWSPDGTKMAYRGTPSGQSHSDIYIANADGSEPVNYTASISNTSNELMPAWSPDGTKIAFASNLHEDAIHYEIYVIDASGRNLKRLTHTPETNLDPDWQPLHAPKPPKSRSKTVHPPDTGGPSLLLVAGALLFSGGVLLYAVARRRM